MACIEQFPHCMLTAIQHQSGGGFDELAVPFSRGLLAPSI